MAITPRPSRRDFLKVAAPLSLGLNFSGLTLARAASIGQTHTANIRQRVKSGILVFY